MNQDKLTDQQKQELEESLLRAGAFEETVRTKGWQYIQAYFANSLQSFANMLIMEEQKPIEDFESTRRELIGLRKILVQVDSDLQTLETYRQSQKKNEQKTE